MILCQISEPLRGTALRDALRAILAVPMPPEPEPPDHGAKADRPAARRLEIDERMRRSVLANKTRIAQSLAKRPPDHVLLSEIAEHNDIAKSAMAQRMAKKNIKRDWFDQTHAWYSLDKIKLAGFWPAALVVALFPAAAGAQTVQNLPAVCLPRVQAVASLAGKHAESPIATGFENGGGWMQVWTTADGATWTISVTKPDGIMCLIAAGKRLETARQAPVGAPS